MTYSRGGCGETRSQRSRQVGSVRVRQACPQVSQTAVISRMLTVLRVIQTAVAGHEYEPLTTHTPVGPISAPPAVLISATAERRHNSYVRVSGSGPPTAHRWDSQRCIR